MSFLVGTVLLAAAVWAQTFVPSEAEAGAPLAYAGALGQTVEADRFAVRLAKIDSAKAISAKDASAETDLLFVITRIEATAIREPRTLDRPQWVAGDGRRFAATDKAPERKVSLQDRFIQPGWWSTREYVFELPPSALPESQVIVAVTPHHADFIVEPFPPEAHLDTGLDAAAAQRLVSQARATYVLSRT